MAGEFSEDYEGPVMEGKKDSDADVDHSRDFMAKPWYTRIGVAVAGPLTNYIFSISVFFLLFWMFGVSHHVNKTEVGSVMTGMAAEQAGLKVGDHILAVAGKEVDNFIDISGIVKDRANQETAVVVLRGDTEQTFMMVPKLSENDGRALIGIMLADPIVESESVGMRKSFTFAVLRCWEMTRETLFYLGRKIRKFEKPKEVAGPVGIFQMTSQAVKGGPKMFITFIAFLSVAIGLFNLFPIPLLDGGHIVFYLIEGIRRKPMSAAIVGRVNMVGLVLLLSLMAFATINDISRFRKTPKAETTQNK